MNVIKTFLAALRERAKAGFSAAATFLVQRVPFIKRIATHPRVVEARAFVDGLLQPTPDRILKALDLDTDETAYAEVPEPRLSNQIFMIIGSFFVIFVLWTSLAELDEVVRAEGSVIPSSDVQVVQNRMSGSVREIKVALGDRVEKDQVLFRLEDEDALANFDDNEITRLTSLAARARLEAEAAGADTPDFPQFLNTLAPEIVAAELELFNSRLAAFSKRLLVLERTIRERETERDMLKEQAQNLEEEIKILEPLVREGLEPRLKLLEAKNRLSQARGGAELSAIAAERSREEYESVVADYRSTAASELNEVSKVAGQAQAREEAFKAKVQYADVRAPARGIVSAVYITTVGAVVQGGTSLAEIVPDEQFVLVRAKLPAENISSVYQGQLAQVSLAAYDVARYGTMEGRVQRIAQNTTVQENMPPFYETIIEIPQPRFSKMQEDIDIIPGMTVTVDIIGRKRSILNYIFTPLERASGVAFREK